jgi:hypothetical protein
MNKGLSASLLVASLGIALSLLAKRNVQPATLSFKDRPKVESPDGKWEITVSGENTEPWVVVESRERASVLRVLPIMRWCSVLWRPDSAAFSIVDARYADRYFLLVNFMRGNKQPERVDLTPVLDTRIRRSLPRPYGVDKLYLKTLRWLENGRLLVGADVVIYKNAKPLPTWQPVRDLYRGYVIDTTNRRIFRELDETAMRNEYGIDLLKETW